MRLRILLCIIGIASFLISSAVHALGLGEISVKSQLNEPLNAEIRLLKVGDLSKEEILVFLASREDFSRAGVDRLFFLNDLRFDVFLANPSYPYIRITSSKPVVEPFLNFLIDVQWPTGRLVREYTLLLDLPTFTQEAPAPVQSPAQPSASSSQPPASTVTQQSRPVPPPPAPSRAAVDRSVPTDSYRVQRGDTLFEIASRSRPSNSVSVNQTMLAIQRVNPEAFISNNINLLQSGRVLRIPSESEINQLNEAAATQEVQAQNRVWSGQAIETGQAPALTASSSRSSSTGGAVTEPSGRLTLGSADAGDGAKGSGTSASGAALQIELSSAQEELDRANRENSELQSRIAELEDQIRTMEQLINVSNDQLRALELSIQQQQESALDQVPAVEVPSDIAPPIDAIEDITQDDAQDIEPQLPPTAIETPAVEEPVLAEPEPILIDEPVVETPSVEPPAVIPPVTVAEPTLIDQIKEKWQVIAAAAGGLLLLILLILRLRKSRIDDEDDGAFEFEEDSDFLDNDDFSESDDFLDEEPEPITDELDLDEDVEAETEDVVAEADIYVSLGQEDKAIELLQKEIQQNPGNADARLGLLGIFAAAQNVDAFDDQYAQLLPLGDSYAIDQAKELRKQMSDAAPFDEDNYSLDLDQGDSGIDDLSELDLSEDTFDELPEEEVANSVDELDLDLDLDLDDSKLDSIVDDSLNELDDLDLDLDDDLPSSVESDSTSESLDELDGLDFDLNLDDEDILATPTDEFEIPDIESDTVSEPESELEPEAVADLDLDSADIEIQSDSPDGELDFDLSLDDDNDDFLGSIDAAAVDSDGLNRELNSVIEDVDNIDLDLDIEDTSDSSDSIIEFELGNEDPLGMDEGGPSMGVSSPVKSADTAALSDNELIDSESDNFDELSLDMDLSEDLEALGDDLDTDSAEDLDILDEEIELDVDDLDALETDLPDVDTDTVVVAKDAIDELDTEDSFDTQDLLSQEDDLPSSMDFETPESLEEIDDDNQLSFEEPPLDLDIDDLDQEIDAMTASLDDELAELDEPEITTEEEVVEQSDEADDPLGATSDVVISEDDDLSFLDETDEVATKLDLAKAYLDMGDHEGAQDILDEVISEGNETQVEEAKALLKDI